MDGLMDTTLPAEDVNQIRSTIEQSIGVYYSYNQLRSRKSGSRRFVEFNLLVPGDTSVQAAHELCDLLEDAIERRLNKTSVNIHVEPLEKYRDRAG
jgi:divalent metal cation (Fe/Co/Zn/Cd) transporter